MRLKKNMTRTQHSGYVSDTEDASDNTDVESMCRISEQSGVEQDVARRIYTMLGSWQMLTARMGCKLNESVEQGCHQGGSVPNIAKAGGKWGLFEAQ